MTIARILVVDDDPDFCEVTRIVLESVGYEIATAANVKLAMKQIETFWPDLILLDIVLSAQNEGLEFGRKLHHDPILRHVPIVFITSMIDSSQRESVEMESNHFVAAWLTKPIAPQLLVKTIGDVLEQRK